MLLATTINTLASFLREDIITLAGPWWGQWLLLMYVLYLFERIPDS